MKKFFVLIAIFALILVNCGESNNSNDENNNIGNKTDITGTWTSNYYGSEITLDIAQDTWVMTIKDEEYEDYDSGTWFQAGNTFNFNSSVMNGTGSLSGETLVVRLNYYYYDYDKTSMTIIFRRPSNSQGEPSTGSTSLKIQNESFSEITDVRWSNVTFTQGSESIENGKFVTKTVQEGDGYIYFKRKTNPINARTDERVIIGKNEQKVFIINDNTIIVDIDNPTNKGTFKDLQPVITTLKIQNDSFSEITDVKWGNVLFTEGTSSIRNNGDSVTKDVQEGSLFIYFKRKTDPINARTEQEILVGKNEQKTFIINDDTPIVDVNNPANKGTFGTLGVKREPQITINVGTTTIEQFGDYDFGGVLINTDRDVIFTIGNSGKADLRFNVVEGNVINLSNNSSGHFSVVQQPFASMIIAPEKTTTFVLRFRPQTTGNNLNAEVTIVTNSENNAQFIFRVKGNGSNSYSIGDTGPGGGIIFFAQGGQFKECSGELGVYNWTDADSQAKNYQGGGLTNWRLPDRGELDLIYQNRTTIGGFSNAGYWSSTVYNSNNVYFQNFSTSSLGYYYYYTSSSSSTTTINPGDQDWGARGNSFRVRAVRAFTL
jgi:hypothetical protein